MAMQGVERAAQMYKHQEHLIEHGYRRVDRDYYDVYERGDIQVGSFEGVTGIYAHLARENTIAILGSQFGDEGKGRIVDNKLEQVLKMPGVRSARVLRWQGGSNAGHTIYKEDGTKIALHQIPSGILYAEAIGIMDTGMVIHMEDLQTEIVDAEKVLEGEGLLKERLILSEQAMLCTDLERAEEVLNRELSTGSKGGTGRGISPTVANAIDRTGHQVRHLFEENWRETFAKKYDEYEKLFQAYGMHIDQMDVPDLRETRNQRKKVERKLGSKEEFLQRLQDTRDWFLERDAELPHEKKLIQNVFNLHRDILKDTSIGVILEGAQGLGLDPWIGRRPDVTSTATALDGLYQGTQRLKRENVEQVFGIMKLTYMSSVGEGKPLTTIPLPNRDLTAHELSKLTEEQVYANWIRETAHEKGTTTGRYRDICVLDLELMRYNCKMGGIDALIGTHLDIAREDVTIKVCTHYTDKEGNIVHYQPGIAYQKGLTPHFIELPGFDGEAVRSATTFDELPENAKKFLSFIQKQMGYPIVMATTGPERKHMVESPKLPKRDLNKFVVLYDFEDEERKAKKKKKKNHLVN